MELHDDPSPSVRIESLDLFMITIRNEMEFITKAKEIIPKMNDILDDNKFIRHKITFQEIHFYMKLS